MIVGLPVIVGLAATVLTPTVSLMRQERQDTIYVLQGPREPLAAFRKQIGEDWTGGTLIEGESTANSLKYWAYSDRTAAEARAFLMPAAFSGLPLEIEAYDEFRRFPDEREKLDQIAAECGAVADPFFVTPLQTVEITVSEDAEDSFTSCLTDGVRQMNVEWSLVSDEGEEQN